MASFVKNIILLFIIIVTVSCGNNGSYYEQITNEKSIISRVGDLNKTINEIRNQEKGTLIRDDINNIKYVYYIGNRDTYIVSYLFDEKGCYEISLKSYFGIEEDTQNVIDGFKSEISATAYGEPTNDNSLYRWVNDDNSIAIEIDYKNTSRGLLIATIFAMGN